MSNEPEVTEELNDLKSTPQETAGAYLKAEDEIPTEIRNNRGIILESESVVTEILATTEHLLDILELPDLDPLEVDELIGGIRDLREARSAVLNSYAKSDIINYRYHCSYKHLLLAHRQLREVIEARITKGLEVDSLRTQLESLNKVLKLVRSKYLNIPAEGVVDCARCLDDYLLNKNDDENGIH